MRPSIHILLTFATRVLASSTTASSTTALSTTLSFTDNLAFLYYEIASAAYCSNSSLAAWSCLPCIRSNVSVAHLKVHQNATTDGRAFTAVVTPAQSQPQIVLSIRGTETLENWVENLKIIRTDHDMSCAGCRVHSGFVDVWDSLAPGVVPELHRLRASYPLAPIFLVGHSLGGAVASLGAYILSVDLLTPVSASYTYGAPRIGNLAFAQARRNSSEFRVTHHKDIVPHLPPEELFGFHHTSREVFYLNDSRSGKICNGSGEDASCSGQYRILPLLSIADHLTYFGVSTGVDGCSASPSASAVRGSQIINSSTA